MSARVSGVEASGVCPMHGAVSHADCPGCRPPPDTRHTVTGMPAPKPGDIWQEQDPRQPRFVLVISIGMTHATIQQVQSTAPGFWNHVGPRREAQLKRFNGKRSGYALHHRSDERETLGK